MKDLTHQRAHWGEGPDEWEWVRWYWAQDGARDLPLWEAFGFSLWETDVDRSVSEIGTPLTPSQYGRVQESVHPGTDYFGRDEWFANGVPAGALIGPPAFPMCEGEGWDTELVFCPAVIVDSGDGEVVIRGGAVGGGALVMASPCYIPFGSCIHPAGGAVGGGRLTLSGGESSSLAGGAVGGGALSLAGGGSLALVGGAVGGGELLLVGSGSLELTGGAVGGGALSLAGGGSLALVGGAVGGGELLLAGGGSLALVGGAVGGGELVMEGMTPGPPTFIAASQQEGSSFGLAVAIPMEASVGNLAVIIALVVGDVGAFAELGAWTQNGTGSPIGGGGTWSVWSRTIDGTESSPVTVSYPGGFVMQGTCVLLSSGGTPSPGVAGAGNLRPPTAPALATLSAGGVMLAAFASVDTAMSGIFTPAMALGNGAFANTFFNLAYEEDVAFGLFGPVDADIDDDDDWEALLIYVPAP